MNDNELFMTALVRFLDEYESGRAVLASPSDLTGHLFYWCRRLKELEFEDPPHRVHLGPVPGLPPEADLALGAGDVLAVVRCNPRTAPAHHDLKALFNLVAEWAGQRRHSHLVALDERGDHARTVRSLDLEGSAFPLRWALLRPPGGTAHFLHIHLYRDPTEAKAKEV